MYESAGKGAAVAQKTVHRQADEHKSERGMKASEWDTDSRLLHQLASDVECRRGDDGRHDDPRKQPATDKENQGAETSDDGENGFGGREDDGGDERELNAEKQGKPPAVQLVR